LNAPRRFQDASPAVNYLRSFMRDYLFF